MSIKTHQLHIILFPFLAHGHMIPTLDIATLLASRKVKATIITTPFNVQTFTKAIEIGDRNGNSLINLEIFKFPAQEVGLPEGYENAELVMSQTDMVLRFYSATEMLREQLEQFLDRVRPDCLIADWNYPWATQCATKFNIPRLVFQGMSYFALCAQEIIRLHEPWKKASTKDKSFVLPFIPHEVKLARTEINPELMGDKENPMRKRMEIFKKSEIESYGVIMNSFYELEPEYAEFFTKQLGRKAWHIGPVSLSNMSIEEKTQRGRQSSIDKHQCLTWLDSKNPASVVYICFGSTAPSTAPQLYEIAMALEHSNKTFIWVVRNDLNEEWLPLGFEMRTQGKGLVIRGWAPQILILEHKAIGAFVTHCGWNSTLEGITAGVPMVTWPIFAEQFYNEKLLTQILRVGVSLGVKKWSRNPSKDDVIGRETIEKAIREIMDGDEAEEMRRRTRRLKDMAWSAVEQSGSSYSNLTLLIDELKNFHIRKQI